MKTLILGLLVLTACGGSREHYELEPALACQIIASEISMKYKKDADSEPLRTAFMASIAESIGKDSQACPPAAAAKRLDERLTLECGDFLCKVGIK